MAKEPPRRDFNVPVDTGRKTVDLPITAPGAAQAALIAERIAKRRGWKKAKIGKPEEK